jgi:hypothetical protein
VSSIPPPGNVPFFTIDDFLLGANYAQVFYNTGDPLPQTQTDVYTNATDTNNLGLVGSERDLLLTVEASNNRQTTTSQILFDPSLDIGYWTASTPIGASGFSYLQYDGRDGDAVARDLDGLGGRDLTFAGNAGFLHVNIANDVSTEYTFTFSSTSGGSLCTFTLDLVGTDASSPRVDYYINFSEFTPSNCFTSIGSIQVQAEQFDQVDTQLYIFEILGVNPSQSNTPTPAPTFSNTPTPAPTFSNTPTPTRVPSQSQTPTPAPSQSRTPSPDPSDTRTPTSTRTPSRTPSTVCVCHCPAFTCALIFDPDDDINNVYYFTGSGFTRSITTGGVNSASGSNSDNSNSDNSNSGITSFYSTDDNTGNSSGSMLTVSFALLAVVLAMF